MDYRVSAEERAAFKRCRRQWDFGSIHRQRLHLVDPAPLGLTHAVRDALAVYYYPGMWDWETAIVLPLVRKAFMRSIAAEPPSAQRLENLDLGTELLERYFEWAPTVDDFAPVKIETDVEVLVPDIREAGRALSTVGGQRVLYTERVAMVVADVNDEYWVMLHSMVGAWSAVDTMLLDETAIAACWAWEQTYLGMDVAGTIHNEVLCSPPESLPPAPAETRTGRPGRGGYAQNEPSGGGRLLPQAERADRLQGRPTEVHRLQQETAGPVQRTTIRRHRAEIEATVANIGAEVLEMLDPDLAPYPHPSPRHCPDCSFLAPCLTMTGGADPAPEIAAHFRQGPAAAVYEPRLGAGGGGGRNVALPSPPPSRPPEL
ncbi:MAG: hypothetical protein WKF79_06285 [Nocardioides sp.]